MSKYIVIINRIILESIILYEGVSHSEYKNNLDGTYTITYNGNEYIVNKNDVLETDRFTRSENIPASEYRYKNTFPYISDYVEPIKKAYNIDISKNHIPQFRDGINPLKDNGNIDI